MNFALVMRFAVNLRQSEYTQLILHQLLNWPLTTCLYFFRETHITSKGIIDVKDESLTIDETVQRIVLIDPVQRKIAEDLPIDKEKSTKVNLGHLTTVTYFPDIDVVQTKTAADVQEIYKLPAVGPIVRKPLNVGDQVFAVANPSNMAKSGWQPATIIETIKIYGKINYNVTYEDSFKPCMLLKKAQIAYRQTPSVMLSLKCRVVAAVDVSQKGSAPRLLYFSGLIAEIARRTNSFRYLIFFDNGAVAYVPCDSVFLIAEENLSFLDDVPEEYKPFLRKYFNDLPERALVKYSVGTRDSVYTNDNWVSGKVKKVDCSIVRFFFKSLNKYEWIYRGSPRLKPLAGLLTTTTSLNSQGKPRAPRKKTTMFANDRARPFVQYTRDEEHSSDDDKRSPNKSGVIIRPRLDPFDNRFRAEFELYPELFQPPKRLSLPSLFVPHRCCSKCVKSDLENISKYRDVNPYAIPVICGWDRQVCIISNAKMKHKREIFYIAPCGRRLRNIEEVNRFLESTDSGLSIDLFTFYPKLTLYSDLNGKRTQGCYYYEADVAKGTENHSLSCINWVNDDSITPGFEYWPTRFPGRDISLEIDPHFLMCCDCTDNCQDRSKCDCQRLTSEAYELVRNLNYNDQGGDGYKHRRLRSVVTTGIWECNPNCACNSRCGNRVVQNGIRVRLQIFRTDKKGWGIRCLHDIPPGAFICIYAAEVLNEELADECGSNFGDEYLADLDYIENVERFKECYEEAVMEEISSSSSNESASSTSDQESDNYRSRTRKEKKSTNKKSKKEKVRKPKMTGKPYRELFGESSAYSLDAKRKGNVGRYFNHSCDPNCYVQNVFIDSHDLRFPWVALFSHKFIPAFTELNWDYNYEIIEGRKLWCYCGSTNCRGRLL